MIELVRRFWFAIPIALLAAALLWVRADLATARADLKVATARVGDLTAANAGLAGALDTIKAQRVDNDAIANAVAAKLAGNATHETTTRTIIEKAATNDPAVKSWADSPVPVSVREALRAH